jgi:hypothetical protein
LNPFARRIGEIGAERGFHESLETPMTDERHGVVHGSVDSGVDRRHRGFRAARGNR